jgi:hypothetical protein
LNSKLSLTAFKVNSELPGSALDPKFKGSATLSAEEDLRLSMAFLSQQELEVELGQVVGDCIGTLVLGLEIIHVLFCKSDG